MRLHLEAPSFVCVVERGGRGSTWNHQGAGPLERYQGLHVCDGLVYSGNCRFSQLETQDILFCPHRIKFVEMAAGIEHQCSGAENYLFVPDELELCKPSWCLFLSRGKTTEAEFLGVGRVSTPCRSHSQLGQG